MRAEKLVSFIEKTIENIISITFLIVLLIGVYMIYDTVYVYNDAGSSLKRYKPGSGNEIELQVLSDEVVAWLTIDGTNIDYPIMQAENNIKYLNLNPYGEYSLAGSIFMDCRCSSDFSDPYSVVYGHHMTQGLMFGALDAFADETYFDSHNKGTLTVDGEPISFKLVAFLATDANVDEIFNPTIDADMEAFLSTEADIYRKDAMTNRLLALTTCKEPGTTDRTVVVVALEEG